MPDIQFTTDEQIEAMRAELRKARGKNSLIIAKEKKRKITLQVITIATLLVIIISFIAIFITKTR